MLVAVPVFLAWYCGNHTVCMFVRIRDSDLGRIGPFEDTVPKIAEEKNNFRVGTYEGRP